jgi:8-amino-7-oxononanoate synthase
VCTASWSGIWRAFFGAAAATLTSAGYTAPLVAAQALAADHGRVLLEERAHACLVDAARLTGLPVARFPHRDPEGLERALAAGGRKRGGRDDTRALVLTDGMFAHDGSVAPVEAYVQVLGRSRGTLLVDDAHGAGVLGRRGRGTLEVCGVDPGRVVLTLTLSKTLGCYGGAVLGSAGLRRRILERSPMFTGNTPLPPPLAAGARAALGVLRREGAERRARLGRNVAAVREGLRACGASVEDTPGPVIAIAPPNVAASARLERRLRAAGIFPPLIRYPNGPAASFFRFALSSEHTEEQVARLREVLQEFPAGIRAVGGKACHSPARAEDRRIGRKDRETLA